MTIQEIQREVIREFSLFGDWEQKYEYLIELGKSLIPLPNKKKTEDKLIKGCQSKVWLDARMNEDKIIFTADSDAILPKGIASLLVRLYSGQKPEDITASNEHFLQEIGLQEFLSPTRANGTLAMIKQIKLYAIALGIAQKRKRKFLKT